MSNLSQYQKKLIWFRNGSSRNFFLRHFIIRHFFPFSTVASQDPSAKKSCFMTDYLVVSYGFSREKALDLSKNLAHITHPKKPDSVLSFMKDYGFDDTQIRFLIKTKPSFLCSDVEKSLKPKIRVFQDLGMSVSEILKLVVRNPLILTRSVDKQLSPWIHFLKTILFTDKNIIKAINRNSRFLRCKLEKGVPMVSFFQKCGVPDERIGMLIMRSPRIMNRNPDWLKDAVGRVGKLGIAPHNKIFIRAIAVLSEMTENTLVGKFEVLECFGWSETDIAAAFQRSPSHLSYSRSRLRQKMEFFVNELKVEPSYIALHPELLTYSVEKRIIPRQNVLQILKSKELLDRKYTLLSIVCMSEKKFLELFVLPHKDKALDVCEAYMRTAGLKLPSMRC